VTCKVDKALIIGSSSYVGQYLYSFLESKYKVISTYFSHREKISHGDVICLDVRDAYLVRKTIKDVKPDFIYLLAYSLNDMEKTIVGGASHVMTAAKSLEARVIFLSTDAVFGGRNARYAEYDTPDYINEYGRAKHEAERIVLNNGGIVVRTSLVYGFEPLDPRSEQLLEDLKKGKTRIAYFSDELRCPIFVMDLCNMLTILAKMKAPRIFHMAGPECLSRLEFARKIASAFNFNIGKIRTSLLKESGLNRPQRLCLDSSLAQRILNFRIRSLDEVLSEYFLRNR